MHMASCGLAFHCLSHHPGLLRAHAGSMHTVDIFPRTPGKALVQCGSASHVAAGMAALYEVAGRLRNDGF